MNICWPTRSRTGSTFVVQLTAALFSSKELMLQAQINGHRVDNYRKDIKVGDFKSDLQSGLGIRYVKRNRILSMKYEDPAKDDFIFELAEEYPNLKFVASYRPLDLVVNSHYNIKTWGHDEADVLYNFSCGIYLYEKLWKKGRLFMIDITSSSKFNCERFLDFLGKKETQKFKNLVGEWKPINTLDYQLSKTGAYKVSVLKRSPRLDRLKEIHDWVPGVEARYRRLCGFE